MEKEMTSMLKIILLVFAWKILKTRESDEKRIIFDPPWLDLGEIHPYVLIEREVRIVNQNDFPVDLKIITMSSEVHVHVDSKRLSPLGGFDLAQVQIWPTEKRQNWTTFFQLLVNKQLYRFKIFGHLKRSFTTNLSQISFPKGIFSIPLLFHNIGNDICEFELIGDSTGQLLAYIDPNARLYPDQLKEIGHVTFNLDENGIETQIVLRMKHSDTQDLLIIPVKLYYCAGGLSAFTSFDRQCSNWACQQIQLYLINCENQTLSQISVETVGNLEVVSSHKNILPFQLKQMASLKYPPIQNSAGDEVIVRWSEKAYHIPVNVNLPHSSIGDQTSLQPLCFYCLEPEEKKTIIFRNHFEQNWFVWYLRGMKIQAEPPLPAYIAFNDTMTLHLMEPCSQSNSILSIQSSVGSFSIPLKSLDVTTEDIAYNDYRGYRVMVDSDCKRVINRIQSSHYIHGVYSCNNLDYSHNFNHSSNSTWIAINPVPLDCVEILFTKGSENIKFSIETNSEVIYVNTTQSTKDDKFSQNDRQAISENRTALEQSNVQFEANNTFVDWGNVPIGQIQTTAIILNLANKSVHNITIILNSVTGNYDDFTYFLNSTFGPLERVNNTVFHGTVVNHSSSVHELKIEYLPQRAGNHSISMIVRKDGIQCHKVFIKAFCTSSYKLSINGITVSGESAYKNISMRFYLDKIRQRLISSKFTSDVMLNKEEYELVIFLKVCNQGETYANITKVQLIDPCNFKTFQNQLVLYPGQCLKLRMKHALPIEAELHVCTIKFEVNNGDYESFFVHLSLLVEKDNQFGHMNVFTDSKGRFKLRALIFIIILVVLSSFSAKMEAEKYVAQYAKVVQSKRNRSIDLRSITKAYSTQNNKSSKVAQSNNRTTLEENVVELANELTTKETLPPSEPIIQLAESNPTDQCELKSPIEEENGIETFVQAPINEQMGISEPSLHGKCFPSVENPLECFTDTNWKNESELQGNVKNYFSGMQTHYKLSCCSSAAMDHESEDVNIIINNNLGQTESPWKQTFGTSIPDLLKNVFEPGPQHPWNRWLQTDEIPPGFEHLPAGWSIWTYKMEESEHDLKRSNLG